MKIAIIGGGFYGCFLAHKLKTEHKITLFEAESDLMTKAATLNQSRLHRGLHYPRSEQTIEQTNYGYEHFKSEFKNFVKKLDKNIYAIHKDSKTKFSQFQKTMDDFFIPLMMADCPPLIKDPTNYQGFIETDELVIDLGQIKNFLTKELKSIEIKLNTKIEDLDQLQNYDLIINTSYTNPNLGLPKEKQFELFYELAAMVCITPPTPGINGITIVDGDFVSLFPNYKNEVTLSSVIQTPFITTKDLKELEDAWRNREELAKKLNVQDKIIEHGREYLKLEEIKNPHLWIAPKVKLQNTKADDRPTLIKQEGKLISVFCSKLDSVYVILDKIKHKISEGL